MSSPPVVEIEELLKPISESNPVGEDLRDDPSPTSLYYTIKDARTSARSAERQALIDPDADQPNWTPLLELVPQALTEKSKDLELTAWYIEALVREYGFAGLRDGFRLARELCEKYFSDIFPLPDEDGLIARVAALTGLNGEDAEGTLIAPINSVPLTAHTSVGEFGAWHYKQALELSRIEDPDKRKARTEQGATTLEEFQRAVGETPPEFFIRIDQDLQEAIDEFYRYSQTLDDLCGRDSPPSSSIRDALTGCRDIIHSVAKDILEREAQKQEMMSASEESTTGESAGDGESGGVRAVASGAFAVGEIRNREDALRTLAQIAEFFRLNEPHTPITYLLQQSVRWGRTPLPDLLRELIPDGVARGTFFRLSGIPGEEAEGVTTAFAPLSAGQTAVPTAPVPMPQQQAPQYEEPEEEEAPW